MTCLCLTLLFNTQPVIGLEPLIETRLAPQNNSLDVSLVKGQYLSVTVSSERQVLGLSISKAGGDPLVSDSSFRAPSNLIISFMAPETAAYRVNVSEASGRPPDWHNLQVTTPLEFFMRAEAQARLAELSALYYQDRNRKKLQKMPEVGEEAARLFEQVGMRKSQVDALNLVAEAWRQLDEHAKSAEVFERALESSRAIGYRAKEAEVLTFIGMCRYQVSDYRRAILAYREAIQVWAVVLGGGGGVKNMIGWTWQLLGDAEATVGEMRQATESFQRARDWYGQYREEGTPVTTKEHDWNFGTAFCLRGLGRIYALQSEKQKAMDALSQALEHYKGAREDYYEPLLLNEMGSLYASLGDNEQAFDLYERALKLEQRMGSRGPEAQTLYLIGRLHQAAGKLNEAEQQFSQSLEIRRNLGDKRGQAAALDGLGEVALGGEPRQAIALFDEALVIQREIGDRYGEGVTLSGLGTAYAAIGNEARAEDFLNQSRAMRRALGDREGEANALYHLARLVARLEAGPAADVVRLEQARELIEAALKQTELIRVGVLSQELRASYLGTVRDYYEFYIDLLMRLHKQRPGQSYDHAALRASEMARARSLLDSLAEAQVDIRSSVPPELLARERDLQQRLSAKTEALFRLQTRRGGEEALATLAKEIQAIKTEYREVLAHIRAVSPRYAALTQPLPLAVPEIRQLLDERTLLLEYSLGEERSFLWAVTREGVASYVLPPRAQINAAARRLYRLLTARNHAQPNESSPQRQARIAQADAELPHAASELSRLILSPVAGRLTNQQLLVVTQETLQFIPFAVLPKPASTRQPLIVDHEIAYLPSASVLGLLRLESANRQPAPQQLAVIADPVFSEDDDRVTSRGAASSSAPVNHTALVRALNDLRQEKHNAATTNDVFSGRIPRLRGTRFEADKITGMVKETLRLRAVDFAANRTLVVGPELNRYRIVHFATHALINAVHPELSGLVLSLVDEQGRQLDGFLPTHEIFNLKLSADLVVLSACQTGLGKEVKGEGLVGMTRSFMHAGASRVVVSLWAQQDKATADLMNRFYRLMLGPKRLPPSRALRAAQLEIIESRRWPSSYFWAGFMLQGDYR